ncbi:hypothetical protein TI01_0834 [Lysobacter sp. A03]|nr:hypothetical protein TI01_0834 [Lysobacter sp. A03]
MLVSILREINDAMSPTLGARSVLLLIRRSLYLTPSLRPILARTPATAGMDAEAHFDALHDVLAHQSHADALTVGEALLQTFYDLIVTLVGLSLTERLLRSVWANHSSDTDVPDR